MGSGQNVQRIINGGLRDGTERLTVTAIVLCVVLLGSELPIGQLEASGPGFTNFPVAYYVAGLLLVIALYMRYEINVRKQFEPDTEPGDTASTGSTATIAGVPGTASRDGEDDSG